MLGPTFITGATGLLGAELVSQLLTTNESSNIVCLVRDKLPNSRFFLDQMDRSVTVVQGDIRDELLMTRIISEYDIQSVFHLAAQTQVETANANPSETFDVNISGTWKLLEAVRRFGTKVKVTLFASSDKAYGHLNGGQYIETNPLSGRFPYDVSKSSADLIAQSYAHSYQLNVGITRCGNLFGPGDLNRARIFPSTILSLLANERPVIRSNGKFIRDYLYVGDAATAYRQLAMHMSQKQSPGEAFNLSYGLRLSVLDVVAKITATMGSSLMPIVLDTARNEILEQSLSSEKAKREFGWRPQFGFEKGLKATIDWYRRNYAAKKHTLSAVA